MLMASEVSVSQGGDKPSRGQQFTYPARKELGSRYYSQSSPLCDLLSPVRLHLLET